MIAQIWQAITLTAEADTYAGYLEAQVIPRYRKAKGNRGIFVLRNMQGEITHFLLFSLWSSHAELHSFAGLDERKIKIPAEEKCYLLAFESIVRHYEVLGKSE